ncbi:hypothetical protein [Tenacibaculum sp. C7A-26P2]
MNRTIINTNNMFGIAIERGKKNIRRAVIKLVVLASFFSTS